MIGMVSAVGAVNSVAWLLILLGAVFTVVGLVPEMSNRWPRAFFAGVVMLVLGVAFAVVLYIVGVAT